MTTARSVDDERAAGADTVARVGASPRTGADVGASDSTDAGVNDAMFDLGGD